MSNDKNTDSNGFDADLNYNSADSDLGIGMQLIAFKNYSTMIDDILGEYLLENISYKNAIITLILQSFVYLGINLMLLFNYDNIEFLQAVNTLKGYYELISNPTTEDTQNIFEQAENIKLTILKALDKFYDEYTFRLLVGGPNNIFTNVQTFKISQEQLDFLNTYRNDYFSNNISHIRSKLSVTQINFLRKLIIRQFDNNTDNIFLSEHEVSRIERILQLFKH